MSAHHVMSTSGCRVTAAVLGAPGIHCWSQLQPRVCLGVCVCVGGGGCAKGRLNIFRAAPVVDEDVVSCCNLMVVVGTVVTCFSFGKGFVWTGSLELFE